ncbi:selection and upkeep of intraepithelial T-cells protein 11-like isoform X4 [Mus pahari]|uniref:selection and upkeep of intraepithelial T-cells protein 11-like isoform X4 n=1 Tax=Mus pahari TaxID=10093 RepID=UPI000A310A20|nr:selection and upkeep of intraepithelial T-cells protein 11-like isoform X4 [Mus pahari]
MEPSASCLPGFFMVFILLKITELTQVLSFKTRACCPLIWEFLEIVLFIAFLPLYLMFRIKGYGKMPCLPSMNTDVSTQDTKQKSSESAKSQKHYDVNSQMFLETYEEAIFSHHQESCEEDIFDLLLPSSSDVLGTCKEEKFSQHHESFEEDLQSSSDFKIEL